MSWQLWVVLVWQVAGVLGQVAAIGRVRKPLTPFDAVVGVIAGLCAGVLIVTGA